MRPRCHILFVLLFALPILMEAQAVDTSVVRVPLFRIDQSQSSPQPAILRPVPAATVGTSLLVGASPFFFEPSRRQNILVRERVQLYRRNTFDHRYFSFDNYTQFLPIGQVGAPHASARCPLGLDNVGFGGPCPSHQICCHRVAPQPQFLDQFPFGAHCVRFRRCRVAKT